MSEPYIVLSLAIIKLLKGVSTFRGPRSRFKQAMKGFCTGNEEQDDVKQKDSVLDANQMSFEFVMNVPNNKETIWFVG